MNAAFLNEVVLESLAQDDLNVFESNGTSIEGDANEYQWRSAEGPERAYEGDDPFSEPEYDDHETAGQYFDNESTEGYYGSGGLTDAEVHELASSLMSLESPAEADEFLGNVLKRATKKLARFARPLVAKVAPLVGAGLGSMVPGVGTAFGAMAGKALGSLAAGRRPTSRAAMPDVGTALGQFIGKGGNPLAGVLQSGIGQGLLGKLMGGQMETSNDAEAQFELAKRTVLALDSMAQEMTDVDEGQYEFDQLASEAMLRSIREHLPPGIRPALIDTGRG